MKSCFNYSEAVRGLHRRLFFMRQSTVILLVLLLSCTGQFVHAQSVAVSGKVTDEKGEPLIGVSVRLKGTRTATSTNPKGEYLLSLPNGSGTLTFTYIGFNTKEVPVNNRTSINVTLAS